MTAANTSVKYFHSAMAGAPTLDYNPGSVIAVLDACLVNGFGVVTPDSIVVASGIATLNRAAGIGAFEADVVIAVTGASPAGLNGEKRVISATATSVTFDATGISDQTATGTISAKLAPAGWAKPFTGTNLAAYQSNDVTSTKNLFRIDDRGTYANAARVIGYESMTDVNTGIGAFPNDIQVPGGGRWAKWDGGTTAPRCWTIIADGSTFYYHAFVGPGSTAPAGYIGSFGDFLPLKSGDAYRTSIHFATTNIMTDSYYGDYQLEGTGPMAGYDYAPRTFSGLGSSCMLGQAQDSNVSGQQQSGATGSTCAPTYPNSIDNSLLLTRKFLYEPGKGVRGYMKGVLATPTPAGSSFTWRDKVNGEGAYAGRKLLAVKCGSPLANTNNAVLFFDITGPWA